MSLSLACFALSEMFDNTNSSRSRWCRSCSISKDFLMLIITCAKRVVRQVRSKADVFANHKSAQLDILKKIIEMYYIFIFGKRKIQHKNLRKIQVSFFCSIQTFWNAWNINAKFKRQTAVARHKLVSWHYSVLLCCIITYYIQIIKQQVHPKVE